MSNPYQSYTPPKNEGLYFKFEDGKTSKIRILPNEPLIFKSEFNGNFRDLYAWLVYNYESEKVQLMQLPISGFRQIHDLATGEWGNPTDYDIQVRRDGSGLETKYSIQPTRESGTVPDKALGEAKLIDLKEKVAAGKGVSVVLTLTEAGLQDATGGEIVDGDDVDLNSAFPPEES